MNNRNNTGLSVFLSLFGFIFVVLPFVTSCGKGATTGPGTNIQYQIVNLAPDLGSVDLYVDFKKVNAYSYFYPNSSGYFYLTSTVTPFQIRPGTSLIPGTIVSTSNIFSFNTVLVPNTRYSLFITGLVSDSSIVSLFTVDTTSLPPTGRGKIRFLNASPRSTGLDVVANGTSAFKNQQYLKLSDYRELPPGNYDFQIFPAGSTATLLKDLQNVTIQDGKAYTLYSYGLAGHADSLAFGASLITNSR